MRVIAKRHLVEFWTIYKDVEQPLKAWYDEALSANWDSPQVIKDQFRNASFVGHNRVIFNIKGNNYRLIVAVAYRFGAVYIKFIGTHAQYDKIDARSVSMEGA